MRYNNMQVSASLHKVCLLLFIAAALFIASCGEQQPMGTGDAGTASTPANAGKQLFSNNCTQCHAATRDMTGPKLQGVLARWNNDTARIVAFVKNPSQAIKDGGPDSYPAKLYKEWHEITMPGYGSLTDGEIMKIIRHVDRGE